MKVSAPPRSATRAPGGTWAGESWESVGSTVGISGSAEVQEGPSAPSCPPA